MRYWLPVFLFVTGSAAAQTLPILDQNPTRLPWYQLQTPHFRVLYPAGFDQTAQQTARRLEQVYEPVSATLKKQPRKLSVILQNQTMISNGFVTMLPRHSEFFAVPPQDPFLAGTNQWLDLLAVHEFRHVVQYDKALQGLTRLAYTVFGNTAFSALTLGVPDWFWEGDAVGTETALTGAGRGRMPNFDLGIRANLLAGRRFTYPKFVGGSYRDNVPNHYVLGYFMSTYLKRNYGADAWSDVLNRYYRFPLYPFSFSNSVKKTTKYRIEELYRRTMADVEEDWRKEQERLQLTDAVTYSVKASGKVFTNYQYPQYLSDHEVIALKSGLGDIAQFVVLDRNGPEKKLFVPGLFNNPEMLSVAAGKICWTEYRYDVRFGQRINSEIKLYDLKNGQVNRLSSHSRYAVAALSPDGSKLVAVRNDESYQTRLVILDAQNGRELRVLDNPENDFFLQPRWQDDNRTLVVVTRKKGGKTIQAIDSETNERRDLLPVSNLNISHTQPWKQFVFFNSPQSGIDNIYALNTKTGQQYQVTSRPLGAYHAAISPNGKTLIFHDFHAEGYRIAEMPIDTASWIPAGRVRDGSTRYFGPLIRQEPGGEQVRRALTDSVPPTADFPKSRFSRLLHAINIYSWGPVVSSDGQSGTVGLRSQDLLNTTQIDIGLGYDQAERTVNYYGNLSYQGLFPIIDVGFQRGRRSTSVYIDRRTPLDSLRSDSWNYNQLNAGIRIPLQLTTSKYLQSAYFSAYYNLQQVSGYDLPVRPVTEVGFDRALHGLSYGLSYSRTLKQSKRDVAPRWGQTVSAVWRTTPFGGKLTGEVWGVQGGLYVPGLGKHHSLRLRAGYQHQMRGTYRFAAAVFYPRGQSYVSYDHLRTASAEYRLPLLNPHWTLGRWVYIQRVKATGFYDAAQGESQVLVQGQRRTISDQYYTTGLDLSFVFNVMRLRTPFEAGVRTIYNLKSGEFLVQPLVIGIGF
ncbi:hypothetical protein GCM10028803_26990 [Larkinella knui]|uniref:Biopolymer transporter Tol n=1 Tax=Larkinella knui TaxID=2025310 RepID=A0A3P1CWP5_9BACT|nr:hypothetical protein [Larkinella knui]RRB17745.1 hypothetical protein EHT87_05550 [Larkinella knui]